MARVNDSDMITALVTSAQELSETQHSQLSDLLARKTHRQVNISLTIDPSVLGGLCIYMNGYLFDHTIKKQLSDIKACIKGSIIDE